MTIIWHVILMRGVPHPACVYTLVPISYHGVSRNISWLHTQVKKPENELLWIESLLEELRAKVEIKHQRYCVTISVQSWFSTIQCSVQGKNILNLTSFSFVRGWLQTNLSFNISLKHCKWQMRLQNLYHIQFFMISNPSSKLFTWPSYELLEKNYSDMEWWISWLRVSCNRLGKLDIES